MIFMTYNVEQRTIVAKNVKTTIFYKTYTYTNLYNLMYKFFIFICYFTIQCAYMYIKNSYKLHIFNLL